MNEGRSKERTKMTMEMERNMEDGEKEMKDSERESGWGVISYKETPTKTDVQKARRENNRKK